MMNRLLLIMALLAPGMSVGAERLNLVWPAPHPAWAQGKSSDTFLQEAGSGDPASGGFGGVRSNGRQFHEGIDIKALQHDRRGEATDSVFAALDGVVRHVSSTPGKSSYGRYIVLEHPNQQPAVYTLYAHLASIAPGIRPGVAVRGGQVLGVMGRSASGYAIPKARAHLHFEIGLRLSDNFQSWYDWKKFGSRNDHGVYNGMNLLGTDPLALFNAYRAGQVTTLGEWFARLQPAVKFRIATRRTPDFVQRYPALVQKHLPMLIAGWEVECDWTGLPFRWTPLDADAVRGMKPNEVRVLEVNQALNQREKSKALVIRRGQQWVPVDDLQTMLQLVFGLR